MKSISKYVVGALIGFVTALSIAAYAATGTQPGSGPALQDGTWLNALAGGLNRTYQYGITAHSGGTQAAGFQLPTAIALLQVDTVAADDDSVLLPYCLQGAEFSIRNAGAHTLGIYGRSTNNPATGSADTINGAAGSTEVTMATNTAKRFFCAKNGAWSAQ